MIKNILIFLLLMSGISVSAAELIIVNHTGEEVRITKLLNKCDGDTVTGLKPIYLKNNEKFIVKNTTPVVHLYEVCGFGYCVDSAMGFKNENKYILEVVFKDGMIGGVASPDDWVGNLECPK